MDARVEKLSRKDCETTSEERGVFKCNSTRWSFGEGSERYSSSTWRRNSSPMDPSVHFISVIISGVNLA